MSRTRVRGSGLLLDSSLKMISPDLANTKVQLEKGRALVEVVDIHPQNNILIDLNGASTKLLKRGLYDFDADHNEVRVFKGSAQLAAGTRKTTPGSAAEEAGLERGDVIQELGRKPVTTVDQFRRAIQQAGNQTLLLLINRGGEHLYVAIPG